jgi:hypothetical protein
MFLLQGPSTLLIQAAVPPHPPHESAVAASLLTQSAVDFEGLHILQVLFGSVALLPTKAPWIQQPV